MSWLADAAEYTHLTSTQNLSYSQQQQQLQPDGSTDPYENTLITGAQPASRSNSMTNSGNPPGAQNATAIPNSTYKSTNSNGNIITTMITPKKQARTQQQRQQQIQEQSELE